MISKQTIMKCALLTVTPFLDCVLSPNCSKAGLVNHWKMDESSGSLTATDSGSGGNDATLVQVNSPDFLPGGGIVDGAIQLNGEGSAGGTGDHLIATGYKGILGTTARTVSAWVRTQSTGSHGILGWGDTTNTSGAGWTWRLTGGKSRLQVNGANVTGDTAVNDGKWHHVAVVMAENALVQELQFYVDGAPDTKSGGGDGGLTINTVADAAQNRDLLIGAALSLAQPPNPAGSAGTRWFFDGRLDDVRIYDMALTPQEVSALYTAVIPEPDGQLLAILAGTMLLASQPWGRRARSPAAEPYLAISHTARR